MSIQCPQITAQPGSEGLSPPFHSIGETALMVVVERERGDGDPVAI